MKRKNKGKVFGNRESTEEKVPAQSEPLALSDPKISRGRFLKNLGLSGAGLLLPEVLTPHKSQAEGRRVSHRQAGERPNILIIFDDQLRRDALGVFGGGYNFTTPHMDRLSSEGINMRNAISSCPLCTPFRGMLMTGRYPTHSGIIFNFEQASPKQNPHCLANVFGAAGYDTGFIGKWHLASGYRVGDGIYQENPQAEKAYREKNPNSEFVPPGPYRLGYQFWQAYNFHGAFKDYWYYEDKPVKIHSHRYETDTEFDQAIAYMDQHKASERPFLLTVAPHPPHEPFREPPEGYLEKVVPADQIHWDPNVPRDNPRNVADVRGYYAMIKNVDDNVGRVLQYLDQSGLAENTIVIMTGDHGEMNGSHGRLQKMVPYREALNIPMIIRWPGKIPESKFTEALHTPMDIFPTLCGLAGVDIPPEVDGIDLSGVLLGKEFAAREEVLIANYTSHWDFLQTGTLWPEWRGVFTGRHTYVKWLSGEEELYDNAIDPYQMNNIISDQQAFLTVQSLRTRLRTLLRQANDDFRPGNQYDEWFDKDRNLLKTGLGPVPS